MPRNSTSRSIGLKTLALLALPWMAIPGIGQAQSPTINAAGETGLTDYVGLPFWSAILGVSWGSTAGLAPANLFWRSGTHFSNTAYMQAARHAAAKLTAAGIVPLSGAQRWEDTWEASLPASQFPGEPENINDDRNGNCCSGPEYTAWHEWMRAHPNLTIMANDGGSVPTQWRPWKGNWGHVSPLMPLSGGDCPGGTGTCTYGDWYAARWGETAALSGAYAINLSDFSDSQPSRMSTEIGYNPEIIAAFKADKNVAVPDGTTTQQSAWIVANAMSKWNDYLASGYAHFFLALANQLGAATGQQSLVMDQCARYPGLDRFYGQDQRIVATMLQHRYLCGWDAQTMQVGRSGKDPAWGVGSYAVSAAREPNLRNGANLEADDSAYWSAIASFNPDLSAAEQQEKGQKLLKRAWLEASWAHIATRSGQVRRALAFMSRDYWDKGQLDPTLQNLISAICPTAPFGFAVYYSVAAERALEQQVVQGPHGLTNPYGGSYYHPDEVLALKNAGVPVGYYVSDAAFPRLLPAAAPAAWIVLEHPELIPSAEMARLTSVAPVLTSVQQVQSFAHAPLAFSGGLTGTGFYDQNGRLIVTVTNPAGNGASGTMTLNGLASGGSGTFQMLDLFSNQASRFSVTAGSARVPLSLSRWDTRAFAITPAN